MNFDFTYLITAASIIGTIANIYKKRWCFMIWLFTNSAWCVIDTMHGLYAQSMLFVVYTILAVWGLIQWRKEQRNHV